MKALGALSLIFLIALRGYGTSLDPFDPGFGMGNHNTILWSNSPTTRQPWTPAAYFGDNTVPFGFAVAGVSYYAELRSLTDIVQATAGLWYTRKSVTIKAAYSRLNALDQFYRQRGYVSLGIPLYLLDGIRVSMEMDFFQCGLSGRDEREAFSTLGWTAVIQRKVANISVACSHLVVEQASDDSFEPPLTISCVVSTARHRYGAQGLGFDYIKDLQTRFRFRLSHGFWIHERIGATFSMATNPVTIGIGLELLFPLIETGAAYMLHPVLGWSRGIQIMYPWRKNK